MGLLKEITDKFESIGYLTRQLNAQVDRSEGIAQLPASIFAASSISPPPHRRIIFRLVPWDAFVFSQLHFTGTGVFINHVREQAARIGYRISADKLEKRSKTAVEVFGVDGLKFMDAKDERQEGDCVLLDSEEDIFRFLRMEYVPPHKRNWY